MAHEPYGSGPAESPVASGTSPTGSSGDRSGRPRPIQTTSLAPAIAGAQFALDPPLSPLEQRVFRRSHEGRSDWSIFDTDVMNVDDAAAEAVAADTADPVGRQSHAWRIDNVIDKCGNRLASGPKKLAKLVAQRKDGKAAPAYVGLRGEQSNAQGSVSTGTTHYSSPVLDGGSSGHRRKWGHRRGMAGRKARRRGQGSSLGSGGLGSAAMFMAQSDNDDAQHGFGSSGVSGSFELADYSTGGSTSTILHRRAVSGSGSGPGRWWASVFRNHHHRRTYSASAVSQRTSSIAQAARGSPAATGGAASDGQSSKTAEQKGGFMRRRMQALRLYVADFIMPGGVNRFGSTSGHMYTESIGYLLAFAIASVAFIMWGTLVPKALCSTNQTFTAADVQARKFVSANGIVSDFTLTRTGFGQRMRGFSGYDVSAVFPMLGELAADTRTLLPSRTQALLSKCVANESATLSFIESWRANSTLYYGGVDDFPTHCPFPQAPQTSGTDCLTTSWEQFPSAKVGLLKISSSEVKEMHASPATSWVIIDDMVFDVSLYVQHASDELVVNGTRLADRQLRPENMFLPESLTRLFLDHPGKDISGAFHDLDIDDVLYKACMVQLFLRGTTQTAKSPFACANTNLVAWVTFGLYFVVLFARLVIAETYGWLRARKAVMASQSSDDDDDDDAALGSANNSPMGSSARQLEAGHADSKRPSAPKCIVVVPCFRESMETLSRTLQGVARSTHGGANTLLWIISDGDAAVLADILCIVAHAGRGSDAKFYGAYGATNASGYASARVFGGFYECGRHRIPYVVTAKDAYQGRVDTLMLVLNFFRSVAGSPRAAHGSPSPPRQTVFLEEEVEARMEALGHAPAAADYCLLLDARMQIDPLAITQFVARMEQSADVVALSGTVYPAGRAKSLLHVLQFFDLYLQHFVAPMCESLAGITCPLNQLFTMYRLRLPSGAPCLGDEGLTAAMAELMKRPVKWRHLAWPGNDCLLAPRLARQFPSCRWAFEPNARAEVELTKHQMVAFDPYQRQWFRSRLATLVDMLRGRIRKPAWPVVIAHLVFPFVVPAAACMLYLEIVISFFGDSPAIVVSELTGGFVGATLILLLARRKWSLAVYFLVYCVIAVPFYHVWIPTTAFFTMNRVWVPPEHADAQSAANTAQSAPAAPESLDAIKHKYLRRLSSATSEKAALQDSVSSLASTASKRRPTVLSDSDEDMEDPDETDDEHVDLGQPSLRLQWGPPAEPPLVVETRSAIRRVLHDRYPQGITADSPEFFDVCECTLALLISAYPNCTVQELAVAVDSCIDELVLPSKGKGVPTDTSPPMSAPIPGTAPVYQSVQGSRSQQTVVLAMPPRGSPVFGNRRGRPVSVILEESSDSQ